MGSQEEVYHGELCSGAVTIQKTNAYEERETYSKEDIQSLFTHLKLDPKEPQEYWIPLIAFYEGCDLRKFVSCIWPTSLRCMPYPA